MPLLQKYTQRISSSHKGRILFLLDQSAVMSERITGSSERKCDLLAKAVNRWLEGTIIENYSRQSVERLGRSDAYIKETP